jgi:hypothetical protein
MLVKLSQVTAKKITTVTTTIRMPTALAILRTNAKYEKRVVKTPTNFSFSASLPVIDQIQTLHTL